MKAINKNRIFSTAGLLIFAVTIGYGQGLLAESAMKLFKINQPTVEITAPEFTFVHYTEESNQSKDSFSLKNYFKELMEKDLNTQKEELAEIHISKTIYTSAIEISYESDIETEEWMTAPICNSMESDMNAEEWMTESFTAYTEKELAVENWMTESLTESGIQVENWMTESLSATFEDEITTEEWMTQSISESMESEIATEEWMTESFTAYSEEQPSVENWMTESFISK